MRVILIAALISFLAFNNSASTHLITGLVVPTVFAQKIKSGHYKVDIELSSEKESNTIQISILSEDNNVVFKNLIHFEWETKLFLILPKGAYTITVADPVLLTTTEKHLLLK